MRILLRSREIAPPKSHPLKKTLKSRKINNNNNNPTPSKTQPQLSKDSEQLVSRGGGTSLRRSGRLAKRGQGIIIKSDLNAVVDKMKFQQVVLVGNNEDDDKVWIFDSDNNNLSINGEEVKSGIGGKRKCGGDGGGPGLDSKKSKVVDCENGMLKDETSLEVDRVSDSYSDTDSCKKGSDDSTLKADDSGLDMAKRAKESDSVEVIDLDELDMRQSLIGSTGDRNGKENIYKDSESVSLGLSIGGWRSTRRRVRVEENESDELVSNVRDADEVDKETKPSLSGETGDGDALETSLGLGRRKYSREEKGKGILDLNLPPEEQPEPKLGVDPVELNLFPVEENPAKDFSDSTQDAATSLIQLQEAAESESARQRARLSVRSKAHRRRGDRNRFQDVAKHSGPKFAHFHAEEEEEEINVAAPSANELPEIEDWPGPFSTAMKIIKDRSTKLNGRQATLTQGSSKTTPVIQWMPSTDRNRNPMKPFVPSLQDLCVSLLAKNAEAIVSLKNVPDDLRNTLTKLLCDSRKMDSHVMDLLVAESPDVVRVKDCSWMTEEQMSKTFGECDTSKLVVLQLDLCGRCLPDYVLRATLARSPKSLPCLAAVSLRGACRVTDAGLSSLVASAPCLRSINLGQCSLITSTGIDTIANSLGLLVRELYLDDCQSIDVMLILSALKKLKCLEVLSVADMETVCDDFICQLVTECGPNMKELCLANCVKLTDISLKAIAEKCSGLCALDLTNLRKLSDFSIGHIANGCPLIEKLKLCRNTLSDEAIAAFLEASGESLTELSLNNIKKVGPNTAISLARRCTRNLLTLDLSWCRNLTDEAVGYIVDGCLSLRLIKLFGCTQISNAFLEGHSNPFVHCVTHLCLSLETCVNGVGRCLPSFGIVSAKEVLRDHDIIFANRSAPIATSVITYGRLNIAWSPHGPMWRMLRKVLNGELLSTKNLDASYGLRRQEVHQTMKHLYAKIGTQIDIGEEVFLMTSIMILSMLWGGTLYGKVRNTLEAKFLPVVQEISLLAGKLNVSDIFPLLAHFDTQGIGQRAKEIVSWLDKIFDSIIKQSPKMGEARRETTQQQKENMDFLHILLELKENGDAKTSITTTQLKTMFVVC
ncbi:hypothetical protein IFM89_033070 [Coptis chinensis]|uniref:Uncharacterized protein n=1 Tax=Coptis chinensis TaxID=261450 RepID=A0A835IDN1_9MAGN|nr:hypothetical protein IFM89_033070 [Coptis chinensis]